MIPGLEPVALKELLALGQPREWDVDGIHDELSSLTPIRGRVCAEHRGNVLEVEGSLQTIICVCCVCRVCDQGSNEFTALNRRVPPALVYPCGPKSLWVVACVVVR